MGRTFVKSKKMQRPSGTCPLCGTWRQTLHRDHKIPKFKGGSDDESNIQYICANCHEDKSRDERIGVKRPPFSDEWKANMATAQRGRVFTAEQREKISAGVKSARANPVVAARYVDGARRGWLRRREALCQ